jgi:hypothetical protein
MALGARGFYVLFTIGGQPPDKGRHALRYGGTRLNAKISTHSSPELPLGSPFRLNFDQPNL